jgi:FMN reductase
MRRPFILGIGGTTRPGSSSERALAVSLRAAEKEGADVELIDGPSLVLPIYAPGGANFNDKARHLVEAYRRCDGLIISTPAYHGSVSGAIKNALDYVEELRTDARVYLDGIAVGCIAAAGGWQAAGQTLTALRTIAHALRAWPTPLGAMLNTSLPIFDDHGACTDINTTFQLENVGQQVTRFALMTRATAHLTPPELPIRAALG